MIVAYLLSREDLCKLDEVGVSRHSGFLTKLTLKQPTADTDSRAIGKGYLRRDGLTTFDRT